MNIEKIAAVNKTDSSVNYELHPAVAKLGVFRCARCAALVHNIVRSPQHEIKQATARMENALRHRCPDGTSGMVQFVRFEEDGYTSHQHKENK
jgi:hypothetical protein